MTTLEQMAATARQLANDLFSHDDAKCQEQGHGKQSCMQAEEDRPLDREEKKKGRTRRPFFAYDPRRMCRGCQAYFFAERAAQELNEMRCWKIRQEAEISRGRRLYEGDPA